MINKLAILANFQEVGKLHGAGNAFENGSVRHFEFGGIESLGKLLKNIALKPKMCVSIGHFPRDGKVIPLKKAQSGDMTRTKDVVTTGDILVIDNDLGAEFDVSVFGKYWGTFKDVSYIRTKSGSTLKGTKQHGTHHYFMISNGAVRMDEAMLYLEAICIVEGFSKIEFYKTGKAVLKTPVDLSLSQSSRVVYEDDVNPVVYEGVSESVDLLNIPTKLNKVLKKAQKIRKKLLREVRDKEYKLHAKYVKSTTGKKLKKKSDIAKSIVEYDKCEVDEKFELYSGGVKVGTVGDLVLHKLKIDMFADLYEPDYAGGSQKAIYYPESQTFFSQAHGGIIYTVKLSPKFNDKLISAFLEDAPHLADSQNIDESLVKIMGSANLVDRGRLIKAFSMESGVGVIDIKKEVERLTNLRKEFDMFFDLWIKGEYEKKVSVDYRLSHLFEYKENATLVNMGGKVLILQEYIDDEKKAKHTINTLETERILWADRQCTLLSVNPDSGESVFKKVDTPDLFINGIQQSDGVEDSGNIAPAVRFTGMDFEPNKDLHVAYNLFKGFPIKPREGDIKAWKKIMTLAFGKKHYDFIMDWFADMYQNPDRKVKFAVIVQGEKGCVPCDTEYLTPTGWKRIDEYSEGDLVCEWSPDGSTSFKKPLGYTKVKADRFTNIKNMTMDMTLSEGHRVPYITSKGNHAVKSFNDMQKLSSYKMPRVFKTPDNCKGIDMTDAEIRLLIMQTADGTLLKKQVRINVKKLRKKKRAVKILDEVGIDYMVVEGKLGFTRYTYQPPQMVKSLKPLWGANENQMKVIYEEMLNWDGSRFLRDGRMVCNFSGNKEDNDLFQYVASCVTGKYVNIHKDKRKYVYNDIYDTTVSNRDTNTLSNKRDVISRVKAEDGMQYCFTTSSSFWLMRQNGRIIPTGNTGKNSMEEILGSRLLSNDNYFRTASKEQLFGKFNGHLASNLLTVGQEVVWGGDHNHDSTLKDMITESTRTIEYKGINSFTVKNFSRLYMTSNADWVVPATSDERRYYVASTTGDVTKAMWFKLHKFLNMKGSLEALMYEMLNRDIEKFNHIYCPMTKELSLQQHQTLTGVGRFLLKSVENGYFGYDRDNLGCKVMYNEGDFVTINSLFNCYTDGLKFNKQTVMSFGKELKKLMFDELYYSQSKNGRGLTLPTLNIASVKFKEATGVELNYRGL